MMSSGGILAGFGGGEQVQHIIHDIHDSGPNWTEVGTVVIAALSLLVCLAVWLSRRKKKE